MMKYRRHIILFTITVSYLFLVFSCVSDKDTSTPPPPETNQKIPDIFLSPNTQYPNDKYIAGIGTGDTLEQAQNMALNAISKQFQVTITNTDTITSMISKIESDSEVTLDNQTTLESNSKASSNERLIGVQYGDTFTDNTGLIYAIAFIERETTGQIYQQKIDKNINQIDSLIQRSNRTTQLEKYALIANALSLNKDTDILIEQLMIIDITRGKIASTSQTYSTDTLVGMLNTTAKTIRIITETSINGNYVGNQQQQIKNMVADLFSDLNFVTNVQALGEGIPYITLIRIIWNEYSDTKYPTIDWDINLRIEENGHILISHSQNGKSKGNSLGAASDFAMKDMKNEIEKAFYNYIISKLN